jgi:hypothetical protein
MFHDYLSMLRKLTENSFFEHEVAEVAAVSGAFRSSLVLRHVPKAQGKLFFPFPWPLMFF